MIRIHHLREMTAVQQHIRRAACQRRRDEEAVPIQAVHIQRLAVAAQPRQVVGKRRPHAAADLDDLRLAEGGMQRVGCRQQLQHGTRTDARTLIALRSEEHTSELQSPCNLVCRLLLEKKKKPVITYLLYVTSTL